MALMLCLLGGCESMVPDSVTTIYSYDLADPELDRVSVGVTYKIRGRYVD